MPFPALSRLSALALCVALMPGAGGRAVAVELRGFRGLQWGDPADKLGSQARPAAADGTLRCFSRAHENLLFGDTPLTGVRYCFGAHGLARIWLDAAAPWAALRAEFEQGYGAPARLAAHRAWWSPTPGGVEVEVVAGDSRVKSHLRMDWHSN